MKKEIIKHTQEELKNMKGSTHWAALIKQNHEPSKKNSERKKRR